MNKTRNDIRFFNTPVGNVGFNKTEHLLCGPGDLNEHTVVDLKQTEELQDLAGFGSNLVDTDQTLGDVYRGSNIRTHPRIRITK